jgi:hypothetical protein
MGTASGRAVAALLITGLAACASPQADEEQDEGEEPPADARAPASAAVLPADLLDALRADLARRAGVAPAAIRVVSARPMAWNDSSLGCPQPGQGYLQMIVDGYHVVLEAGGRAWDYRSGARGVFVLCEHPPAEPGGRPRDAS